MTRLVLHVGDLKTATTTLQQALLRGACRCATQRIVYAAPPEAPYNHALAHAMGHGQAPAAEVAAQWDALAARVRAQAADGADVVVASSELFRHVDPAQVAAALAHHLPEFAGDRLRVVAYTRPHAARALSGYAQVVKLGWTDKPLNQYVETTAAKSNFRHHAVFAPWRAQFGARFTLRPMLRRALVGGDIMRDFFTTILEDAAFELDPMPALNSANTLPDLVWLRALHQQMQRHHRALTQDAARRAALRTARMRLGERLGDLLAATPPRKAADGAAQDTKLRFDRATLDRFTALYADDAAAMDATFFDGDPLMARALEDARAEQIAQPQPMWMQAHFSAAEIRTNRLMAQLCAEMLMHVPEGWDDHFLAILNATMRGETPALPAETPRAVTAPQALRRLRGLLRS